MSSQHENLFSEEWYKLSLCAQLGNIGSEISRMLNWQDKNQQLFEGAKARALALLDLTIQDPRWQNRLKELVRVREVFNDAISGSREYNTSLFDFNKYFFQFALAARIKK